MKEKKDLSLVYALKEYARVNGKSDPIIDNRCFTFNDIKAAFNAGRERVVESLPELEWKGYAPFIHADTPIGRYNIDNFVVQLLRFNGKEIPTPADCSLEEAKQAANEDYKKRIKQALGL
ncbi:hypothetical protein [Prevotella melaninogenica]|uniref:hypothetical protein n=1 Tax=Prevotella melaninogenica TaxID=28132 RepID=UPI001BACE112|nr:hypothetical protein [Prevotella melaninogenica]QUB66051.1 hypothetical protein J5A57_02855 [Prevotella melaninogenica]